MSKGDGGEVTRILCAIEQGNAAAAEELLPLVYDELRKLAASRMRSEPSDHTLQPTALVHEAYMRLVEVEQAQQWDSRGHFFAAAAEAMRRILIERARRHGRRKRGGDRKRIDFESINPAAEAPADLLAIDEALQELAEEDAQAAELVRLHLYAGLPIAEAGDFLGLSRTAAYEQWAFARASLAVALE